MGFPTHGQQPGSDQPTSDQQPCSDQPTSDQQPGSVQPTSDQQPASVQPTSDQQPASSQQLASDQLPTHVQLQLFLVCPDAVTKEARVVEVTLENHSACIALFKESEMFDYWSLFRAYRTKSKITLTQGIGGCVCECDVEDVVYC